MLHPASIVTAGIVMVFAVFLMLLQALTQRLAETRSLPEVTKASARAGVDVKRITTPNPYIRAER
jgi:hypothetical protein